MLVIMSVTMMFNVGINASVSITILWLMHCGNALKKMDALIKSLAYSNPKMLTSINAWNINVLTNGMHVEPTSNVWTISMTALNNVDRKNHVGPSASAIKKIKKLTMY